MSKTIISVMLLLLISIFCGKNNEQVLGDNYFYLPDYEAIDIGFPDGAIIYKSPQRLLFKDIKIPRDVISVSHDHDFIIAIQKINSVHVKEPHQMFAEKDQLQYFIIKKESDVVYGPYNKEKYLQIRNELGVSKNLTFKENN